MLGYRFDPDFFEEGGEHRLALGDGLAVGVGSFLGRWCVAGAFLLGRLLGHSCPAPTESVRREDVRAPKPVAHGPVDCPDDELGVDRGWFGPVLRAALSKKAGVVQPGLGLLWGVLGAELDGVGEVLADADVVGMRFVFDFVEVVGGGEAGDGAVDDG